MAFFHAFPFLLLAFFISIKSPFHGVDSAPFNTLTDKQALLSFKASISDPSNILSSWNDSSTLCNFTRVSCNRSGQRVVGLHLARLQLTGTISPFVGNLSFLRYLYLQENRFTGPLPDPIGNLFRLQVLNMSTNFIDGAVPPNISKCTELMVFDITGNRISGSFPPELGRLSKLQVLNMGHNQLSGTIPPSLGNLSSLTTLNLRTNSLHGTIPSGLGYLPNLKYFQISLNNIRGTVPLSLYNRSSLVTFAFASNQLWGEIPSDIGFKLPNLLDYHTCFNKFTGPLPSSLNNITNIESIRMSNNFHSGSIPQGLGSLPKLRQYNIGFNKIISSGDSGLDFITSLGNSKKLEYLAFDENLLEGLVPETIGNLSTNLRHLYMGRNHIYGSIPASIGRLTNLALLNLSHNSISGEIPPEIGQLKELQMLGLAQNRIQGRIPASLGNLAKLNKLELFGNDLEGSIPVTFGNFQSLLSLDLSNNRLNGSIPNEVFCLASLTSFLNLSKNSLKGSLSQDIGILKNVQAIDVSKNNIPGSIPNSIRNCKSLQDLLMSQNLLSGPIPASLGEVRGLQTLDLSSNELSSTIPSDLQNLQVLQFLNLSFNHLEGEVPSNGIFHNLSAVHLEGNSKLCTFPACRKTQIPSSHGRKLATIRIIAGTAGSIVVCLVLVLLYVLFYRRQGTAKIASTSESFTRRHQTVSYLELLTATGNFNPSNIIGSGGFGSVFKGVLRDGMAVAIKVLDLDTNGASKSFLAECNTLRNVRHRNLVKLITSCSSVDFRNVDFLALVYEFVENGSLQEWIRRLRRTGDGDGLNVVERLKIAIDVACAMDYLHHDCDPPVVHCDLEPSNVLLDEELNAKVGDFGLARLMVERGADNQYSTTNGLKGSIGYIPPEYGLGGKPSTEGDVYSYGVMLLELFTGKSPTDATFTGDLSLHKWVLSAIPTKTMDVLDPALLDKVNLCYHGHTISAEKQHQCLVSIIVVGLSCTVDSPEARISMRDVLHKLKGIEDALMKPALIWAVQI
ncbi:putative receptor-like protein kinase At3g47110 [Magnolia sinica]|uniref:putative receptor-like protein kinase At3g47110 n=1 Tax=Magnolia sinica TaxID=86752 RepID=UPI00265A6D9A|nr:putative receptor-like protein kinase At3g47110 [Magnolia sinica]